MMGWFIDEQEKFCFFRLKNVEQISETVGFKLTTDQNSSGLGRQRIGA